MTNPPPYWFPAKRRGWGWGPPSAWQGWVVMASFAILVLVGAVMLLPTPGPLVFVPYAAFSSVLSLFAWSRATSVLALGPQVKARPDASLAPTCNGFAVARGRAQTLDTMKHLLHCLPPTGVLAFAILLLVACVEQFDAVATNHRSDAVVIGIAQYHSERFDGTPPRSFPAGLLIQQGEVTLGPGERRTLVFDSASGGFWLRWQQLAPTPEPGTWVTIDIGRDARTNAVQ